MEKLFAIKNEEFEFYAQIEITENISSFLDKLALLLYSENWMIDDHYQGNKFPLKNNYFSYKENDIQLITIMAEERAHIVILGLADNREVNTLVSKYYSFTTS